MEKNKQAEQVLLRAKAWMKEHKGSNTGERWHIYEYFKQTLSSCCSWGREYETYIQKLAGALKL